MTSSCFSIWGVASFHDLAPENLIDFFFCLVWRHECCWFVWCCVSVFVLLVIPDKIIFHDDVINWKHFPRNWSFVRGIHRSLVDSPHWAQWRWALIFSLICAGTNGWANNRDAGDLRRHGAHYDVTVMRKCRVFVPFVAAVQMLYFMSGNILYQ